MSESLEVMEAMALKQYKVGKKFEYLEIYTVNAHDPKEAIELVKAGNGRHAGKVGPFLSEIFIRETDGFDDKPPKEIKVTADVRKREPLIKVP